MPSESTSRVAKNPKYELYHPKWYRSRYPILWWLKKMAYGKFMVRELTSLAVGYLAVLLMLQVRALSLGEEAYVSFQALLMSPAFQITNGIMLLLLMFHSVTWLNLAPKALVLYLGKHRVPDIVVLVGHYSAWFAATTLVIWFLVVV